MADPTRPQPNVASSTVLAAILRTPIQAIPAAQAAWQTWIDGRLSEWERDPGLLDDEDVEPPTREIVALAIECARQFSRRGASAPLRIVPDADGGIVFEWLRGAVSESLEIADDGTVEYLQFVDCRLVYRQSVALDPQVATR